MSNILELDQLVRALTEKMINCFFVNLNKRFHPPRMTRCNLGSILDMNWHSLKSDPRLG